MFANINSNERKELERLIYKSIIEEFGTEEKNGEQWVLDVIIQNVRFETYMSDSELQDAVHYTIELLEELKKINNSGIDREALDKIVVVRNIEVENPSDECEYILIPVNAVKKLYTDKIYQIKSKLEEICKVNET